MAEMEAAKNIKLKPQKSFIEAEEERKLIEEAEQIENEYKLA